MSGQRPVRVVMLGGGYATVHAYRAIAARRGGRTVRVTVVSADDCHNYHGFTGEVMAGLLPLELTRTPLAQILSRAEFVHGRVVRIDRTDRLVRVEPMDGTPAYSIGYDQLIVATGGREPLDRIPGMAEHGYTLRAPGEFERLLVRLSAVLSPAVGSRSTVEPVAVVGGGMAGVELAAAIADRVRASGALNPVLLLHSGPAILPDVRRDHPRVAARAERELARLGVHIRCDAAVVGVRVGGIELPGGTWIPVAAVLATTGQRAVVIPGLDGLSRDRGGRLIADANLSVAPGIWAAGDAARVPHPTTGAPVAANALWAIKAGAVMGRNVSRVVNGRRPRALRYRGLGQAMAFGIGRSATELYGIPIPGVLGWVLRLGFFLRFLPQRSRALQVLAALGSVPSRGRFGLPGAQGKVKWSMRDRRSTIDPTPNRPVPQQQCD